MPRKRTLSAHGPTNFAATLLVASLLIGSGCATRDVGASAEVDYAESGPYQHGVATDAFDMGLGIPASEAKINDAVSDLSESVVLPAEAILGPPAFYYVDMDQPVAERGLSIAYDKSDVRLSVEPGWSEDRLKNMAQRSISATDTVVAIRGNESSISIGSNLGTTLVTVSPGEAVSVAHGRIKVEARVLFVRGGFLYTLRSYDAAPELLAAAAESVIGAK